MARSAKSKQQWKERPDDHDYPAAEDYLSLTSTPNVARKLARRLREAPIEHHKAKDLLRASRLPLLAPDNFHVAKDLKKVAQGRLLSPVLLVRGIAGSLIWFRPDDFGIMLRALIAKRNQGPSVRWIAVDAARARRFAWRFQGGEASPCRAVAMFE